MITPNPSKLLLDDYPLLVLPSLAAHIGLNESMALQQLHYWILSNREKSDHWHEDRCWCYNTYVEWKENNFPFWSVDTIERAFVRLRNKWRLVIVGNFNRMKADRTLWYTIDYDAVESLSGSIELKKAKCGHGDGSVRLAIPETIYRDYPGAEGSNGESFTRFEAYREYGWEYVVLRRPQPGIVAKAKRREAGDPYDTDVVSDGAAGSGEDVRSANKSCPSSTGTTDASFMQAATRPASPHQHSAPGPCRTGGARPRRSTTESTSRAHSQRRWRQDSDSFSDQNSESAGRARTVAGDQRATYGAPSRTLHHSDSALDTEGGSENLSASDLVKYIHFVREWERKHAAAA